MKTSKDKKLLARILFFEGKSQEIIAHSVGVTQATISNWVKDGNWEDSKSKIMSIPLWAMQTAANVQKEMFEASESSPIDYKKVAELLTIYNNITQKTDIVHLTRYNIGLVKFLTEKVENKHASEVLDPNKSFIQNMTKLLDDFIKDYLNA